MKITKNVEAKTTSGRIIQVETSGIEGLGFDELEGKGAWRIRRRVFECQTTMVQHEAAENKSATMKAKAKDFLFIGIKTVIGSNCR